MLHFGQGPLAGVGGHRCGFSSTGEQKRGPKWQGSPMKTTLHMNLYTHFNRTMFSCLCAMHTTMLLRVEVLLERELAIFGKSGQELFNHGIPSMFPRFTQEFLKFPKFPNSSYLVGNFRWDLEIPALPPVCLLCPVCPAVLAPAFLFWDRPNTKQIKRRDGKTTCFHHLEGVCCLISILGRWSWM
jgi:hypothetical protein